jgi:hypothetical protein
MAGELDLFNLFVGISGNIFISMFIIILIMLITGILGRMSIRSIIYIVGVFIAVFMIGYVGAIAAIPLFIWAAYYMISGIINWWQSTRG